MIVGVATSVDVGLATIMDAVGSSRSAWKGVCDGTGEAASVGGDVSLFWETDVGMFFARINKKLMPIKRMMNNNTPIILRCLCVIL